MRISVEPRNPIPNDELRRRLHDVRILLTIAGRPINGR